MKGNSKRTSGNSLSPLGVQNKDLCAASQTVEEPTQGRNILDLFLTNNDSLVQHTTVKPGIGDRDVEILCNAKPQRVKTAPHRAFLWKKVDFKAMKKPDNQSQLFSYYFKEREEKVETNSVKGSRR